MAPPTAIDAMRKAMTPELDKVQKESWGKWMDKIKDSTVDRGAPTGTNMRVNSKGMTQVRNEICGYTVVEAETLEDAAKFFTDSPMLAMPEAYVEVAECLPMS